jgi:hypothetical protein
LRALICISVKPVLAVCFTQVAKRVATGVMHIVLCIVHHWGLGAD